MSDYIIILQYATISCQACTLKFRKIIQIMAWPNEYIVVSCFEINYKQYVIGDFYCIKNRKAFTSIDIKRNIKEIKVWFLY